MTLVSQSTEYALRALVFLAAQEGRACSASVLAENTEVPAHYLAKVLKQLAREGMLTARRGPGGGFAFRRSPDTITVLDVVNIVDPIEHVQRCPLGRDPHGGILCPLHQHLEQAIVGVENAFRSATIGELARSVTLTGICTLRRWERHA